MKIAFSDKTEGEYEVGTKVGEIIAHSSKGDLGAALVAKVNGRLVDLSTPLYHDAELEVITFDHPEGKRVLWHSAAHVMAQAVTELFPGVKLGTGPAIEDGFYYDFDLPDGFSHEDLARIEAKMAEIVRADLPFQRMEVSKEEGIDLFRSKGEDYKVELISELDEDRVSLYRQGDFVDLCLGPHVPSTGWIRFFKLLSIAGAYWRGDERQPMLQRIYGTAYPTKEDLEEHLHRLEEAKRRDHRRLGTELDLFSIHEEAGVGLIFWHPKGAVVRKIIEDFWRDEHYKRGYELVYTPHIAKIGLWQQSGHLDFFWENMYPPMEVEGQQYLLKPMNCPGHILIYKRKIRSYRDLPLRWAELGTVYRYERSGVLHGLLRVRGFTQDDAHIFCRPDQLEDELVGVIDLAKFMMTTFGFEEYEIYLSTRPERYVGTLEVWKEATQALIQALKRVGMAYQIDPGEGIFYGPKVDIKVRDSLGRSWQGPTVQVDFNEPERFDVTYIGSDGLPHRVVMVHRTVLGSLERFIGCLIEHYAGAFPTWLAPVQVRILPIADRHFPYAEQVQDRLLAHKVRVEVDFRNEKVGYKIREAETQKIPYMLIVGDKEVGTNTVSVRGHRKGDLGGMDLDQFLRELMEEIEYKGITIIGRR